MKAKPLYQTSISYEVKDEWMFKEYGSWEDHNYPNEGHVYPLLKSMPQDKIVCNTMDEVKLIETSAYYQTSWDSDDNIVKRLQRKAANICKQLSKL